MNVKHLTAFYGKKEILSDLNFSLTRGTFTALIGKNGSGKSTLLGCINGQVRYQGEILLQQRPLQEYPLRERAKRIAILPQFLPSSMLSAEEVVTLGRNPYLGLSRPLQPDDHEKIEEAIRLTEIQALRHRSVSTLSGGERQKVYLAMLLAQDADLLLLDEPTSHMDMEFTAEFLSLLRSLTETQGKTVLAVLHNLNDAVSYAHHLLLLHNGRLHHPDEIEALFEVQKIFYDDNQYFYK